GWSDPYNSNTSTELLPGSYSFNMYFNNGSEQKSSITINPVASQTVLFTTVTVTPVLKDCDDVAVTGGTAKHYQNGWSGSYGANTTTELLPGNYTFRMYLNNGSSQQNGVAISGAAQDVIFDVTKVALTFDGIIKIYQNGWLTYSNPTYLLHGNYTFNFNNTYQEVINISGCEWTDIVYIFLTKKHDGSPLPNMLVRRNDYGSHFVDVGTTDANGVLFATNLTAGPWKFRVSKNYSYQDITSGPNVLTFQTSRYLAHVSNSSGGDFANIEVEYNDYGSHWIDLDPQLTDASGNSSIQLFPGNYNFRAKKNYSVQVVSKEILSSGTSGTIEFQTSKYIAHVTNSVGTDFQNIEVEYNDYGSHWIDLDPQYTDVNGNSSIELFPGNYQFRAKKNYSYQNKYHEILTSGTSGVVEFQTSEYVAHVSKHDGSDFEGIEVEYNDYGSHWIDLDPQYTDINGNSSIELFPGNFTFRAKKNYSYQQNDLEILTSGTSDIVEFQTSLAVGLVKDCDNNSPVSGIEVEYNDYGSHWIDLDPQYTGVDGKSSIELFPGTYTLRAKNLYTVKELPITLEPVSVSPTTTVEFNPTRVCFNYGGTVKYNDYGSHWINLPCDSYMFPGTYDFRFGSNTETIAISGCAITQTVAYIKLLDSNGNGIQGQEGFFRIGGTYYSAGLTDVNGEITAFMDGNLGNTYFKMKYLGHTQTKLQNIISNPEVIFQTTAVTVELRDSYGDPLAAEELFYRDGSGTYVSLGTSTASESIEMLPLNYYFKAKYLGHAQTLLKNVNTTNPVVFKTKAVTVSLKDLGDNPLNADELFYRNGAGTYVSIGTNTSSETLEMLPLNYYFKATYSSDTDTKLQNVNSNSSVEFVWNGTSLSKVDLAGTFKAPELNIYPNPAISKTILDITLYDDDKVFLAIFDMSGRTIQVLHEGALKEGTHKFKLNFTNQPEGTYICRMIGEKGIENKMIVVKH
ncbi:MAG: T9SS type A sorting domain-containing protein, partial [Bacteroidetes bacterium]|nr:T9SS type A sorting domain-containing protein [Bacteroidota bacterium]